MQPYNSNWETASIFLIWSASVQCHYQGDQVQASFIQEGFLKLEISFKAERSSEFRFKLCWE